MLFWSSVHRALLILVLVSWQGVGAVEFLLLPDAICCEDGNCLACRLWNTTNAATTGACGAYGSGRWPGGRAPELTDIWYGNPRNLMKHEVDPRVFSWFILACMVFFFMFLMIVIISHS